MTDVIIERRGPCLWITINRLEKRNALNDAVIAELARGYEKAERDPEVRLIVLTGAGEKAFCAGADLQPGQSFSFDTSVPSLAYANLLRTARHCRIPSIARINGACMAGGMGLLCMTDLAVAADHAIFGLPEVKIGLFPMQVLALLKDLVLPRVLREWSLTGVRIDAAAAMNAGLLNKVVPASQLDAAVDSLAQSIVANSPAAIRRGKYALDNIEAMPFETAIAFAEGQIALIAQTEDAREGLQSFAEKRDPRWTGR